ncbi:MAG: tRNA threonylcarbamoyladenosine biosynthesis protein TsaE [Planctomycetota bacterium]|jgi:tRNA threonylcarbamoyladenosine biosynthesis protein TsaE
MGFDENNRTRNFTSLSPEATEELGAKLASLATPGLVVVLEGELGAGKTCFVRGFARGLGVTEPVSSPTFALMNEYEGRLPLLHYDAWMEDRERSFLADGGADMLGDQAVALIEWGERVEDCLPRPYLRLELRHAGGPNAMETRRLQVGIVGPAASLEGLLASLSPNSELLESTNDSPAKPAE